MSTLKTCDQLTDSGRTMEPGADRTNRGVSPHPASRSRRRDLNIRLLLRVLADEIRLQKEKAAAK